MHNPTKITEAELLEEIALQTPYKEIAKKYGVAHQTVKNRAHKLKQKITANKPLAAGTMLSPDEKRERLKSKRFVITSAQNNTFIVKPFLKSLEVYAKTNQSELLISTFTYNKNGYQKIEKDSEGVWYDKAVQPYIKNDSCILADGLLFCGELNILPTAVDPLSGLHNYCNTSSGIIPHAKLRAKSMPVGKGNDPRLLYTTGAVTQRNYIQQKAGQKAEHHHSMSALSVEISDRGQWFVRQLCYDKKLEGFYDLDMFYSANGVKHMSEVEAITFGDIHSAKLSKMVADVTWRSKTCIMNTLKPKYAFCHDVHDQQARNHHNIKDPHFLFAMHVNGTESVVDEVKLTCSVINEIKRPWCKTVIVESNHDLALEKWLKEQDYRRDPVNAIFFLEMQLAKYQSIIQKDKTFSIFEHACKLNGIEDVEFLRQDQEYWVAGVNNGNHSHLGNNGGRGSVKAYVDRGTKENIGHGHGFEIWDGVWRSGVSGDLDMGYNVGGSSWNHTHILTYSNGKRCGITIKNGEWRG
jgi:hypothetical protein